MKPKLFAALLAAGLLGSSAVLAQDAPAAASPPPAAAPAATAPPADNPAKTRAEQAVSRRNTERDAFFEARVAALHAGLTLNPDQEKLWPALETAIRDLTTFNRGGQPRSADAAPGGSTGQSGAQAFDELKRTADDLAQRGRILSALADAGAPLYAALDQAQKDRLPILMRDLTPPRGPFHRLVAAQADGVDRGDAAHPERGRAAPDDRDDGDFAQDRDDRSRMERRGDRARWERPRYDEDRDHDE